MLSHPKADQRIIDGAELILDGNIERAYMYFRNPQRGKLDQFGPSFITKFFYFVGSSAHIDPMPLILDEMVTGSINLIVTDGHEAARQSMTFWQRSNDEDNAYGYAKYVKLINEWADSLEVRADAIEMALFDKPSAFMKFGFPHKSE